MSRLPRPGEVWTFGRKSDTRTVVNVYPDAVTFAAQGAIQALTVDQFVNLYDPPEPTVVDEVRFRVTADGILTFDRDHDTHRLEALSDGTVRLVEVDS